MKFRWGRLIGNDCDGDDEEVEEVDGAEPPPWSALFLGGAKIIKSAYNKRRSRSIDLSPRPATAMAPIHGRGRVDKIRRRSSSIDTPEKKKNWMKNRSRMLACSLPTGTYNPPKFAPLDFSLNESELENGPGTPLPNLHIDDSPRKMPNRLELEDLGDSDDNSINDEVIYRFNY